MKDFFKALKREWHWYPTRRDWAALVCVIVGLYLADWAGRDVTATYGLNLNVATTASPISKALPFAAISVSLLIAYALSWLCLREASVGRPASAAIGVMCSALTLIVMTAVVSRPVFVSEVLDRISKPNLLELTPEVVWESYQNDGLSRELYFVACGAIVDFDTQRGTDLRQCIDPDDVSKRLSLAPSERAREAAIAESNIRQMNTWGYKLLFGWIAGLLLVVSVFVFQLKRAVAKGIQVFHFSVSHRPESSDNYKS